MFTFYVGIEETKQRYKCECDGATAPDLIQLPDGMALKVGLYADGSKTPHFRYRKCDLTLVGSEKIDYNKPLQQRGNRNV